MDFSSSSSSTALGSIDRKPSAFSLDDNATLDCTILDTPLLMSPSTSTQAVFSPDTSSSLWEDFSQAHFVDRTPTSSVVNTNGNNPFFTEQSNNPFARLPPNQAATYGQQSWPVSDHPASRTPTAPAPKPLNPFGPGDFGAAPFVDPSPMAYHGLPIHTNHVRPTALFSPSAPDRPLSPHTHSDWMAFNQQEMDARPGPKRMRPNTPPRSYSPRRDGGIRKKNARFDIPAERNLFNIDNLIQTCTNEDDLKELKQQKRLLRNRQAALDSRQRKKKHTEELEEEKKIWMEKICGMQDEFANLRVEYDALCTEKENWHRESMELHHLVSTLQYDKEELIRSHTLESGDLRKKVSVLTERLEAATSNGMAAAPSTTFTDFASEMDNLTMGHSDWDNYLFVGDFASDEQTPPQQQPQERSLVPRVKEEEKPVASGLLLMLLLCGAFVASKSGNAAPPIPRMPDEVRAASATVLDSIFKDAGVSTSLNEEQGVVANHVTVSEPAPSSSSMAWPKTTMSGSELAAISDSHLDQLHAHLTGPTQEQEHEQLFSITPAQYNSMTSMDFTRQRYSITSDDLSDPLSPGSQPSHRRNLAETLAAMREQNKGDSAAEIYTRSLLWDKIAPEVVHEFKRIVEESTTMSRPTTSDGTELDTKE